MNVSIKRDGHWMEHHKKACEEEAKTSQKARREVAQKSTMREARLIL
jgi:hypothetical protein